MSTTSWQQAKKSIGMECVRIHDLRHTFGRRLRSAGVTKETRKALLGHSTGDITTHYSAAEIGELLEAVEKITSRNTGVLVRDISRKTPAMKTLRKI